MQYVTYYPDIDGYQNMGICNTRDTFAQMSHNSCEDAGNCLTTTKFAKELLNILKTIWNSLEKQSNFILQSFSKKSSLACDRGLISHIFYGSGNTA